MYSLMFNPPCHKYLCQSFALSSWASLLHKAIRYGLYSDELSRLGDMAMEAMKAEEEFLGELDYEAAFLLTAIHQNMAKSHRHDRETV